MTGGNGSSTAGWLLAVDEVAIAINVAGLVGNLAVLVTVTQGGFPQRRHNLMIGHQACIDCLVCLISIFKLLTHENLNIETSNKVINYLICYLWVSKLIYWTLVFVSVLCLVLLCVDRYLSVVRPMLYRGVKDRTYILAFCGMHFTALLINIPFLTDMVVFSNGRCNYGKEHYGKTIGLYSPSSWTLTFYGCLWLSFLYFIPTVIFLLLYSLTLMALRRSKFVNSNAGRRKLSTQLTKSAAVLTGLYLFSFTIDTIYFLLAFFDKILVDDIKNPINRVGSLFVNFHSISPFVYCLTLRGFRERLILTLTCGLKDVRRRRQETSISGTPMAEVNLRPTGSTNLAQRNGASEANLRNVD